MYDNKKSIVELARMLEERNAGDVLVLDIREQSSIADYFVIATVTSAAYLRGLIEAVDEYGDEHDMPVLVRDRRPDEAGWTVIDGRWFVVHLMTRELRNFYDLERLWFHSPKIYGTGGQSSSSAGQSSSGSSSR
ncbi:MAG: ribosome silencing factor [Spirochaetaceae bacterium]